MSRRSWQRVIVWSGARINNDGLLTGHRSCPNCTHRIARHHSPYARRRRGSGEAASEFACAWPKKNTDASAKKLTRPDGEIRAQAFYLLSVIVGFFKESPAARALLA